MSVVAVETETPHQEKQKLPAEFLAFIKELTKLRSGEDPGLHGVVKHVVREYLHKQTGSRAVKVVVTDKSGRTMGLSFDEEGRPTVLILIRETPGLLAQAEKSLESS